MQKKKTCQKQQVIDQRPSSLNTNPSTNPRVDMNVGPNTSTIADTTHTDIAINTNTVTITPNNYNNNSASSNIHSSVISSNSNTSGMHNEYSNPRRPTPWLPVGPWTDWCAN